VETVPFIYLRLPQAIRAHLGLGTRGCAL
jgi:hypothetical protein